MHSSALRLALLCVLFGSALHGQNDPSLDTPYENKAYGLTVKIPDGWQRASAATAAPIQKAVTLPDSVLLIVESAPDASIGHTVVTLKRQKLEREFGVSAQLGKLYGDSAAKSPDMSVLKEPVVVQLGGLDFYRTDLKTTASGHDVYFGLLASGIKDSILVFQVRGPSQAALDDAVRTLLGAVRFVPAWSLPDDRLDKGKLHVRVSSGVSEGLIQKKVSPSYPEDARHNRVQGSVRMHIVISREGNVQAIWILDGHPLLAEAAVDAVHRWKYKPYLLNGEPVLVDSTVVVNFNLR